VKLSQIDGMVNIIGELIAGKNREDARVKIYSSALKIFHMQRVDLIILYGILKRSLAIQI